MSETVIVGIAGGSGSGKTTFGRMLEDALGVRASGILSQDSYYRDLHEYFDRDGGLVNFDHPESIEFELLVEHLDQLKAGRVVEVPRYDFATHQRLDQTTTFAPRSVVIVDGILILSQPALRERLNISVYIDTAEAVRFARRLARDVRERGRTPEGVTQQFERQVKPMHDLFVEPSRRFADHVISGEVDFAPFLTGLAHSLQSSTSVRS